MPGSPKGTLETILVVDDNHSVLTVVVATLRAANFRVLSANSGPQALKLAQETDETIHLLLSDVEMPEMSGPDLGQALKKARPGLACHVDVGRLARKFVGFELWLGIHSKALYRRKVGRDGYRGTALTRPVAAWRPGVRQPQGYALSGG